MITLTPAEDDILRPWLINRIRAGGQTINYKALAEELDPDGSLRWNDGGHYRGLSRALFHIANFEVEHGRPVGLVALVINKTRRAAGGGFAKMARGLKFQVGEGTEAENQFWELKLAEAASHWNEGHQDGPIPDAQFDAIMAELAGIKRMLRTLVYGNAGSHPQTSAR